jgi:predicted nucleic acid-binding protein
MLERIARAPAVVPAHWILEVTSGLLLAARRGHLRGPDDDIEIMARLGTLPITVDPDTARHGWKETSFLARQLGLTTCDAAYLELALRLQAPLATLDRDLASAARTIGIALIVDELPGSVSRG